MCICPNESLHAVHVRHSTLQVREVSPQLHAVLIISHPCQHAHSQPDRQLDRQTDRQTDFFRIHLGPILELDVRMSPIRVPYTDMLAETISSHVLIQSSP